MITGLIRQRDHFTFMGLVCDASPTCRYYVGVPSLPNGEGADELLELARLAGWEVSAEGHYCNEHKEERAAARIGRGAGQGEAELG
jgi:hypothetical protein